MEILYLAFALAVKVYFHFRRREVESAARSALKKQADKHKKAYDSFDDELWDAQIKLWSLEGLVIDHLDFLEEQRPEIFRSPRTLKLVKRVGTTKIFKEIRAKQKAQPTLTVTQIADEIIARLKAQ